MRTNLRVLFDREREAWAQMPDLFRETMREVREYPALLLAPALLWGYQWRDHGWVERSRSSS